MGGSRKRKQKQKRKSDTDKRNKWAVSRRRAAAAAEAALLAGDVPEDIQRCIEIVPYLKITSLRVVVDKARQCSNRAYQEEVVRACLQRLLNPDNQRTPSRTPRAEQVRTLRRLIYLRSDVLLIARTGFGKSLIFHAYSILTGLITLQVVPLLKLGEEQLADIRMINGTRPCFINAKTRQEESNLLRKMAAGEYTHVLLGPEQASTHAFRRAIRDPEFQCRLGLVAIDECHLVNQWKDFRPAFTLLCELRTILPQEVEWFGCSATLDDETEKMVLKKAGFRSVGNNVYQTEVIRTSVDRPDVALSVLPIPKGKLTSWDTLYFLLLSAVSNRQPTPQVIPKTIVFVDGRASVQAAAAWARSVLLRMTTDSESRYSDKTPGPNNVFSVVHTFTATVSEYDRSATYAEFQSATSTCRIVFATTSLGMGVNIPDVARVVVWKMPITESLADAWQRLGRGGRKPGMRSDGYLFLPYWMFDSVAVERPEAGVDEQASTPVVKPKRKKRNQLPRNREVRPSRLSQCSTPGDISDVDDSQSGVASSQNTQELEPTISALPSKYWTKAEMANRRNVPKSWLKMVNGTCYRRGFLSCLGEYKLPAAERIIVAREHCCSKCEPSLLPTIVEPPPLPTPMGPPRANTHAAYLVEMIDAWSVSQATKQIPTTARFPMPPGAYMPRFCRWQLGEYCAANPLPATFQQLCSCVPLLLDWDIEEAESLMAVMPSMIQDSCNQYNEHKQTRKKQRLLSQVTAPATTPLVASERDDQLAEHIALLTSNTPLVAIPPTLTPTTPTNREYVEAIISSPGDVVATLPATIPDSIQRGINRLQQIRAQAQMPANCSPASTAAPLSSSDNNNTTTAIADSARAPEGRSTRRVRDPNTTPTHQRVILGDITPSGSLVFSPLSSRGRKRKLTYKGQENYRV